MPRRSVVVGMVLGALLVGCGGGDEDGEAPPPRAASSSDLRNELKGATSSTPADFPATRGRTLQQVADSLDGAGPQIGLATSVFTPGNNRFAFGILDPKTGFIYGKTGIYVADGPNAKARGPYPAPADLLITDPAFRSQTAASEGDPFAAIYSASVPLSKPGRVSVLAATRINGKLFGATSEIQVRSKQADRVPAPGEMAPKFETDTVAKASGNKASIDTRLPPDDMHETDAAEVLGKRPVAVIFATPQLCESRVCGPVVDIVAQLKATYGNRMTFIHQEVFEDNDAKKPLREPLRRFNLPTEPWFFVMDRTGRVTARLEGSFGFDAVERAIKTGLN